MITKLEKIKRMYGMTKAVLRRNHITNDIIRVIFWCIFVQIFISISLAYGNEVCVGKHNLCHDAAKRQKDDCLVRASTNQELIENCNKYYNQATNSCDAEFRRCEGIGIGSSTPTWSDTNK